MGYVSIAQNNKRARWIIAVCVVVCTTAVLVGFPLLLGVMPAGAQTVDSAALCAAALQGTNSLKTVTVLAPSNFNVIIRPDTCSPQPCGRATLHILGKALFWDQQLGSDGQACASCYFHAGTDKRSKNQPNPGLRNQTSGVVTSAFNDSTGFGPNLNDFGPNSQWSLRDFPFHHVSNPDVNPELDPAHSSVISDTNDIASSQGVFNTSESPPFFQFNPVTGIDFGTPSLAGNGAICNVAGMLVRNVEPCNTLTVINAVLNHRNFWNSRTRNEFNPVPPISDLDPTARVVKAVLPGQPNGTIFTPVRIQNCSACSQADEPSLSYIEMSFGNRRFADLGKKMQGALLVALGQQLVAKHDSVLGLYNKHPSYGITWTYAELIKRAFQAVWWNSPDVVDILARPSEAAILLARAAALLPDGNPMKTAAEALIAAAESLLAAVPPDPVTTSCELAKNPALSCPTIMNPNGSVAQANGALDLLASALSPQHPLLQAASSLLPDPRVPGTAPKLFALLLRPQERVAVDGAHKAPSVHTVELTTPYFHNGEMVTLEQVVEFYNRGGNFPITNRQNLDVDMQPIGLSFQQKADLVAFLKSLTDPRVKYEMAPFDHPSLNIPNGGQGDTVSVTSSDLLGLFSPGAIPDDRIELPAVGAGGGGARDTWDALWELPRSTHTMIAGLSVTADGDGHVRIWLSRS